MGVGFAIGLGGLLLLIVLVTLVLHFYPVFGAKPSKNELECYKQSPNFRGRTFTYPIPTTLAMGLWTSMQVMLEFMKGSPSRQPAKRLPMVEFVPRSESDERVSRVTWFGHSALMLELEGKRLLLDPMFGPTPSPVPIFGGRRYSGTLPFQVDELPWIDAVLLSHDHFDHLDYGSILKLKDKIGRFFVPLGVKPHLVRWGVDAARITEHDWWEEAEFAGLKLACTPARHFSGRSLRTRNTTLWCSWVIRGEDSRVFFSGDSGYGPHFREIGERYGPFELTLMECGQYDTRWAAIHMLPEETVQAHLDVRGRVMLPIHWGAFTLAVHDWTDPVERAVRAAERQGAFVATPRIGEPVIIGSLAFPTDAWWRG